MRVLLITQLFDFENAIKGLSFAKDLVALGHEVEVVTTYPSYPGGKILPDIRCGCARWRIMEVYASCVFLPHCAWTLSDQAASELYELLLRQRLFIRFPCRLRRPDVIYSYYPPMVGGLRGCCLVNAYGAP